MLMSPTTIPGERILLRNTPPGRKLPSQIKRKRKVVSKYPLKRNPTSKAPKILPIKEPKLLDAEYSLEPMSYHVTINPRNQEPVNG